MGWKVLLGITEFFFVYGVGRGFTEFGARGRLGLFGSFNPFSMNSNGWKSFNWVLPSCYLVNWVGRGFTGFYRVFFVYGVGRGFTEFGARGRLGLFGSFNPFSMNSNGWKLFNWVLPSCYLVNWVGRGFTEFYLVFF